MFISEAHAQTAAAASSFGVQEIMLPILMVGFMWFFIFRPQMKRTKQHQKLVNELQKGDEIVTSGGVVGRIVKVDESFVTLEIAANTNISVQRQAVTAVLPKGTLKSL